MKERLALSSSVVTREGLEENYYCDIFDIVINKDDSILGSSDSTDKINIFCPGTGQKLCNLGHHDETISSLSFPWREVPHVLLSSSADGTVKIWDVRTPPREVGVLRGPDAHAEIWSLNTNDNLISGGGIAQVLFWDVRKKTLIACLEDNHKECVTQVCFHPRVREALLTASTDGRMTIVNTNNLHHSSLRKNPHVFDDHDTTKVMNVEQSIQYVGFYGDSIWCTTHDDKLSLWSYTEKSLLKDFGHETRMQAALGWDSSEVRDLIGCHYSERESRLWIVGSNNEGSVGFFPVTQSEAASVPRYIIGPADGVLHGGHEAPIRCICWSSEENNNGMVCWTGGRDGRICSWSVKNSHKRGSSWVSQTLAAGKVRFMARK